MLLLRNGCNAAHLKYLLLVLMLFASQCLSATTLSPGDRELQRQQERQQALERQLQPEVPDIRLLPEPEGSDQAYPDETPCFAIDKIMLVGAEHLPDAQDVQAIIDNASGRCLGLDGIRLLMSRLQNLWVARGLITTRVLAPPQDLADGTLELVVVRGVVRDIELSNEGRVNLGTAIPSAEGDLLDLRDIEQGLENLQRLPTVQANFNLVPGELPGESDVVVDWQQDKIWRVALSADNSGSEGTGKYRGTATLYLDNALGLSDLFYVSRGIDLHKNDDVGTDNYVGHFSVPLGYWMVGYTVSGYDWLQTVAGITDDIEYTGTSRVRTLDVSRVVQRSARSKTAVNLAVTQRRSRNDQEDVEVEVQRRETAYWELMLSNRYFFDRATFDSSLSFRKGTRWFGANPAPEEMIDDGTALSEIVYFQTALSLPFELVNERFRWNSRFFRQWTNDLLTPQDQLSIGGRYTVRGFDGELSLSADRGWYLQNDLAWLVSEADTELFLGFDYGKVTGAGSEFLPGRRLSGVVAGIRGNFSGFNDQVSAGRPVSKPRGFATDNSTLDIDLSWEY